VLSPENNEGEFAVDISLFKLRSPHNLFALKVKGESMIDAHIVDGDMVIVRVQSVAQNGDIVVALVNGEATVKRLFVEKSRVRLQPENSSMQPFNIDRGDFRIIGRVVGVVRRI
jgi:repressor LexA